MKFSIITINYNNREGLKKTIESVVSQTIEDFEWIVVDGGSKDGSKELIEQYQDHITWWCSEPDKGIYNAMNKGILKATGEYCFFLNSGDYLIDEGALQRAMDCNFTEDVAWGYFVYDRGGHLETGKSPVKLTTQVFIKGSIHHTGNAFIKRELFDESKYGLYDENLKIVSDWKWFLMALGLGSATGKYYDVCLSAFDCTGISESQVELRERERKEVMSELIPSRILEDYAELDELQQTITSAKKLSNRKFGLLFHAIFYKVFKHIVRK